MINQREEGKSRFANKLQVLIDDRSVYNPLNQSDSTPGGYFCQPDWGGLATILVAPFISLDVVDKTEICSTCLDKFLLE